MVSGDYFQAMQIPLREGRFFNEQDTAANPRVALVDEYMARQLWPHQDPVGRRLHLGGVSDSTAPWITIVGVVGRVKQYTLDSDSRIAFYLPQTQYITRDMNVVVRSVGDSASLAAAVKREILNLDGDLPLYNVVTMEQRVAESLARRRFSMLLLTLFASLALALAAIGTYGVMAYLVNQGTREIGIRIALGATPGRILSLVVSKGMTMALFGLALGLAGAFAFTRLMSKLLFGVQATDPATFAIISVMLIFIALLASYIPAQRAARVDPMVSLRYE
jgi:predicted permease